MGVVVNIKDMIMQSYLQLYDHAILRDINSQIREVMELEITMKRKKGLGRVQKEGSGTVWLEKRGCIRSREMARAS